MEELIKQSKEYAKKQGFKLNPDRKIVEGIVKGLLAREEKFGARYCPCRRVTGDAKEDEKLVCPCFWHLAEIEKDGHCFCNLFVKA